jgi:ribokinase
VPDSSVERRQLADLRVVVIGDVMVDVLVDVRAAFAHASDTTSRIATAPGGSAANLAVWLARAGAHACIVASVGRDPFGQAAVHALKEEGVDTSSVLRVAESTGTVVALVEPDGQRSMLTDRGANLALCPGDVEAALAGLREGDHVHVSGYLLLDDATRASGLVALERVRASAATWSLDASSAGPLRAIGPGQLSEWARGAHYFFCNLDEAALLTGRTDALGAARVLAESVREAVVTDGPRGAVIATTSDVHAEPASLGTAVTDTTGAGDAFNGTYLALRLGGGSVPRSAGAAALAAAAAVALPGARRWGYSLE